MEFNQKGLVRNDSAENQNDFVLVQNDFVLVQNDFDLVQNDFELMLKGSQVDAPRFNKKQLGQRNYPKIF